MSKKVVLAGACRTAIGKMGGALSTTPAPKLGSIVIEEALKRAGVPKDAVDHVYMGCVIQAGLGQNVARQASIGAGLPIETTAVTVNVVCGSGLNCVNMAAQMIQTGDADIVVAGGMENMSMAPYAAMNARFGYRMNNGKLVDTMVNDALWDAFNQYHMMITAENVAEKYGITREELDEFSANSQQKCEAAIAAGKFKDSKDKLHEVIYLQGDYYLQNDKNSEALKNFQQIENYKDAKDKIKEVKYRNALKLMQDENTYTKAADEFSALGEYKDSKAKATEAKNLENQKQEKIKAEKEAANALKRNVTYNSNYTYKRMSDIYSSVSASDDEMKTVTNIINRFYVLWVNYVNTGDSEIFDLIKEGTGAYNNAITYRQKNLTESTEKIEVNDVRKTGNNYFVWTHEIIHEYTDVDTRREYHWVYRVTEENGKYYVIDYTVDPAYN